MTALFIGDGFYTRFIPLLSPGNALSFPIPVDVKNHLPGQSRNRINPADNFSENHTLTFQLDNKKTRGQQLKTPPD